MNLIISGGTGFIGKYVCQQLSSQHQLTVLSRNPKEINAKTALQNCRMLDLSESDVLLKEQLKETEVFIHLAAKRPAKKASDQSFESYIDFLRFSDRVLNLLKDSDCKHIIYISTKGVYGANNTAPFTEGQIPHPTSLYGLSKLFTEQMCDQFGSANQIAVCHLRLGQVIGWGESQKNIISVFLNNAINKQAQQIWGQGIGARTYVYVKDVVNAIETAIRTTAEGAYNIGWPQATTHALMAETINKVFNNRNIEYLSDKPEDTSIEEICTKKAKEMLGWKPAYATLEDALLDMKKDHEEETI